MLNIITYAATAVSLLSIAACSAIQPARMALPEPLKKDGQVVEIEGVGGGTTGEFNLGKRTGRFHRSSSRLRIFEFYDGRGASLEFEFDGIEAKCQARERQLNFSYINFSPKPMAYTCTLSAGGKRIPSHFEVQESKDGIAGKLAQQTRRGELLINQRLLKIKSSHALLGSPITLRQPIGYVFEFESQVVGAVEINGGARIVYDPKLDPALLRSIEVASLALGLLWDPGEYDLVD